MLPTHVKPRASSSLFKRQSMSLEKQLLLLLCFGFAIVCFGAFMFAPELMEAPKAANSKDDQHVGVQTEDALQQQPFQQGSHFNQPPDNEQAARLEKAAAEARQAAREVREERERLQAAEAAQAQQRRELEQARRELDELKAQRRRDRQALLQQPAAQAPVHQEPAAHAPAEQHRAAPANADNTGMAGAKAGAVPVVGPPPAQSYATAQSQERRDFVKGMMKRAWDGYRQYAWGENELMPKAKRGHSAGIFGRTKMGATIVDALDTLWIMGLKEEFNDGRRWIDKHLSFDVSAGVSVFEVTIRFVGGLLSAYAMSGDDMFKDKALDISKRLLPAFKTATGIPKAMVNLQTGSSHNWGWASGGASILSEFGTMQLEWEYLSLITQDPRFAKKARHVMKYVTEKQRPATGLYPNYLNPDTGSWGSNEVSLGALGDSFYEYLLKEWVLEGGRKHGRQEGRQAFDDAMKPVRERLVQTTSSGLTYVAEAKGSRLQHKMGHLACFAGGMFALAAKHAPSTDWSEWYMKTGAGITATCHESYRKSPVGIGPEAMLFGGGNDAWNSNPRERYYILRPETVEAYFYMWRLTHEQKYRDWAWEAVQAIEKHCRCGVGYCGIKDVGAAHAVQDDVQQSFFLAETLKYLYLIFEEDNVIDLDQWVFNTEAHPFPVQDSVDDLVKV
eukprot:TRINITY_DN7251_c0_g1_i2.p1 TRINITY_DN7251_c0_g1~~TRINITY_DN7251_c0_g1_i2.p1  ORF type:complete len:674 (+),score=200.32 TRINITY_DN7251_c0_g1_i2:273-2294(+)